MAPLLSAWLAEMILIAYRGSVRGTTASNPIPHLAVPAEYAGTFVIFGALSFVPGQGQRVAGLMGWALVVATALNLYNAGGMATVAPSTAAQPTTPAPATKAPPANVIATKTR